MQSFSVVFVLCVFDWHCFCTCRVCVLMYLFWAAAAHLVVLCVFGCVVCIWLCSVYLVVFCIFGCVVCICSTFALFGCVVCVWWCGVCLVVWCVFG